ncbi:hypothetical protein ACJZ2D_013317 [Fusarium nematophilum]
MSSHNEKPDQIWVDKTFTAVVDTAVVEPLFTVTVWADSPPPSVTPISLADIFDPCLAWARHHCQVFSCGTADMDEEDEKQPLLGEKD